MKVEALTGDALLERLPDLARLRIGVFREWPYLYDGTLAYEANYLHSFRECPNALLVAAFHSGQLVGVSTGTPLLDHADDFSSALNGHPIDPNEVYFCAESVLLSAYRGRGLGHKFFDIRENHARSLGFRYSSFCAVIRPPDHPAHPKDYRPLDAFWRKRGYAPLNGAIARFDWKDVGEETSTTKPLQFWIRAL